MTRKLYNIRLLGDRKFREPAFDAFLDGYATSLDIYPRCGHPATKKPINALWEDFVRISADLNATVVKRKAECHND